MHLYSSFNQFSTCKFWDGNNTLSCAVFCSIALNPLQALQHSYRTQLVVMCFIRSVHYCLTLHEHGTCTFKCLKYILMPFLDCFVQLTVLRLIDIRAKKPE